MHRDVSVGMVDDIINLAMVAVFTLSGKMLYSGLSGGASSQYGLV